jgi:hypothetical protein
MRSAHLHAPRLRPLAAFACARPDKIAQLPPCEIVWTSYKKELGIYQGALEHKEAYAKAFLRTLSLRDYDVSKMVTVLNALVSECSSIAADARTMIETELRAKINI